MAEQTLPPPAAAAGILRARIRELGAAARFLLAAGYRDVAREVEFEQDRIRRQLAEVGGPAEEPTLGDAVAFLTEIRRALTPPEGAPLPEVTDLMDQRVAWVREVADGVLKGTQDLQFAASFLAAQTARLQPQPGARTPGS